MIPQSDYLNFTKALKPIFKDCFLITEYPDKDYLLIEDNFDLSQENITVSSGCSSITKGNTYLFNKPKALTHKNELLQLCKSLPKLKTIITGTAGTIAYTDLLPDKQMDEFTLKKYCEFADKFIGLLSINGIGYPKDFVGTESFQAATINLMLK